MKETYLREPTSRKMEHFEDEGERTSYSKLGHYGTMRENESKYYLPSERSGYDYSTDRNTFLERRGEMLNRIDMLQ